MTDSVRTTLMLAMVVCAVSPAWGQGRGGNSQVPRYTPSTPTVSPYVGLLNRNGAASNYYGLVRPLERQQTFNKAQAQIATNQEQQIRNVQSQQQQAFDQPTVKPTGTAGWFQTMGQNPPFQVSSHYYGQWSSTKAGRRTSSGR